MRFTDFLLCLLVLVGAIGVGVFVWSTRQRARETEIMRAAMYTIAHSNWNTYFKTHHAIPVTLDPSVNKAITRFAKTSVDMQGMIELAARWLVMQMPPEAIEDMGVPEDWASPATRITRQGIMKET